MENFKKISKRVLLVLVIILALMAVAFKLYTMRYYRADKKLIEKIESSGNANVENLDKNTLIFTPKSKEATAGVVFYPGGKVEYSAYSGLLYKLAENGIVCILPRMPENLAFLNLSAAGNYKNNDMNIKNWYLAGHSLGGVAAGEYMARELEKGNHDYTGMILCASYITNDLSHEELKVLNIYGSNDKILNIEKYRQAKRNLPHNNEIVIVGGNHSYFGCYGQQAGDGKAEISNEEQLEKAAKKITDWINSHNK